MSNQNIVIFTASYPYGHGEGFICDEIDAITEKFDDVVIQPATDGGCSRIRHRGGRESVREPLLGVARGTLPSVIALFKACFNISFWRQLPRVLTREPGGLPRLRHLLVSTARARMLADRIQSSVGLQEAGLWYFYWGAGSVAALPFLPKTVPLSVVRFHGSDLYGVAGYAPYQRELLSRVARVFTVSRAGEDHLLSLHGRVPPIKVMRLGTAQPSVRAVERQKSHEGFHIVSCARAVSLKRLPLIAQALRLFAESHLDDGESILWTHFGEGPDLAAVQRCSKPPHPRVTIKLMGDVENIKILEFYASVKVDGFVSVSSTEGIPVSMMEAASCGIPILSTDVGGCREVVGVETGVLISANPQLEEIASGMSDLLRGAFSSNGIIEFWAEFFDSDKNCGVVAHELRKLVP